MPIQTLVGLEISQPSNRINRKKMPLLPMTLFIIAQLKLGEAQISEASIVWRKTKELGMMGMSGLFPDMGRLFGA